MLEYNREAAREARRRRIRRERMIGAGTLAAIVLGGIFVISQLTGGGTHPTAAVKKEQHKPKPPPTLPRGGREVLPDFRVVAYDGAPQTPVLGPLGDGTPAAAAAKLELQAQAYSTPQRPALPAFELLATIAQRDPGDDGNYSAPQSAATIDKYLAAARKAKALLILDIQPGQASFMSQVKYFSKWLKEPDVGVALDSEWSMRPGQVPGTVHRLDHRAGREPGVDVPRGHRQAVQPSAEAAHGASVHERHDP